MVATATESVAENENTEIIEVVEDTVQAEKANIAVLMPLMLNENNPDKHTRASNDFIRGFMLGMKSMSDQAARLTCISTIRKTPLKEPWTY